MSVSQSTQADLDERFRAALMNQYHAGLAMLRAAIQQCPESEWADGRHVNAFWQVAYHALYFTHLYLQPDHTSFRPWKGHQSQNQNPDGIAGPPDPQSSLPLIPEPYSKAAVLEYWDACDEMVDDAVRALDIHSPDSGFPWYAVSKLEHQLVSIRHLQHHTAQLVDRLRSAADIGVRWVGSGRRST
jgi:hypothetical protein